jgi:hypothetical protein
MTSLNLSAAACAAITLAWPVAAETARVLAEFPPGTFLENLTVGADGAVVATNYFARTLERIGPDDQVGTFATLDVHPVSILPDGDGWIVAAHGEAFTSGPGFTQTQMILRLDATGREVSRTPAPGALFLNGLVRLPDGRVLVADSIAGTIWQVSGAGEAPVAWLQDPFLAQPADMAGFQPGANGLKLHDGALFVSNSARGALARVELAADGAAAGGAETVLEPGGIDDFWIAADGTVTVATHGETLVSIAPDGGIVTLLAEGCDSCTAVAPRQGPEGPEWVVLTTGKLLEGGGLPARVLAVPAR